MRFSNAQRRASPQRPVGLVGYNIAFYSDRLTKKASAIVTVDIHAT